MEYIITARFEADINNLLDSVGEVNASMSSITVPKIDVSEAESASKNIGEHVGGAFTKAGDLISGFSVKLGLVGGALATFANQAKTALEPLNALGSEAFQAYVDVETGMTDISRTTDLAGEELEQLLGMMLDYSKRAPVSFDDMVDAGDRAGKAGLDSAEGVMRYIEVLTMLEASTDATMAGMSDSAGKFLNITTSNTAEFERDITALGSTLTYLGNNVNASEDQIMKMSQRVISAGTMAGFTEAEVLALGATMLDAGVQAERGGTAMSSTMSMMQSAVLSGGEDLEKWAKAAGVSTSEFSAAFRKKPMDALRMFLDNIANVHQSGGDVTGTLRNVGIEGVRQVDVLRLLALSLENLDELLVGSTNEWNNNIGALDANGALMEEYGRTMDTTASRVEILENNFHALQVELGQVLVPTMEKAYEAAQRLMDWFNGLDNETKDLIAQIALATPVFLSLVAAFGGILVAVAPVIWAFGKIVSGIGSVITAVSGLPAAIGGIKSFFGATGGFATLKAMLAAVNPILAIVVAAIVALAVVIWQNWDKVKPVLEEWWARIKTWASNLWETIKRLWGNLKTDIDKIVTVFVNFWESTKAVFKLIWDRTVQFGTDFWAAIMQVWHFIKPAIDLIVDLFVAFGRAVWETLKALVELVRPIWDAFVTLMKASWEAIKSFALFMWEAIKAMAEGIWEALKWLWSVIQPILTAVWEFMKWVGEKIVEVWNALWGFLKPILIGLWEGIKSVFNSIVTFLRNAVSRIGQVIESIITFFTNIFNWWADNVGSWPEAFWGWLQGVIDKFNDWTASVEEWFDNVIAGIGEFWDNFIGFFTSIPGRIQEWADNLQQKFDDWWGGITSWFGGVGEGVGGFADDFIGFFRSIPERVQEWLDGVVETVAGWGDSLKELWDSIPQFFQDALDLLRGKLEELKAWFQNVWDNLPEIAYNAAYKIVQFMLTIGERIVRFFVDIGTSIWEFFKSIPGRFTEWRDNMINKIIEFIDRVVASFQEWRDNLIESVVQWKDDTIQAVKDFATNAWESFIGWIDDTWESLKEWAVSLPARLTEAVDNMVASVIRFGADAWDAIVQFAVDTDERIRQWAKDVWEGFKQGLKDMWDSASQWVLDTVVEIGLFVEDSVAKIKQWAKDAWDGFWQGLRDMWDSIVQWKDDTIAEISLFVDESVENVKAWAKDMWEGFKQGLQDMWDSVVQWGSDMWDKFVEVGNDIVDGFVFVFTELPGKILEWLRELWQTFRDWGNEAIEKIKEIGGEIISGLWEGIKGGATKAKDTLVAVGKGAWDGIKDFFKVRSPSRVAMDLGNDIMAGMSEGFEEMERKLGQTAEKLMMGVMESFLLGLTRISELMSTWQNETVANVSNFSKGMTTSYSTLWQSIVTTVTTGIRQLTSLIGDHIRQTDASMKASNDKNRILAEQSMRRSMQQSTTHWTQMVALLAKSNQTMTTTTGNAFKAMLNAITTSTTQAQQQVSVATTKMVQAFVAMKVPVLNAVNGMMGTAVTSARNLASGFVTIGQQMSNGLVSGIRSRASAVTAAAQSVAKSALAAAKKSMQIKSPSRLTMALGEFFTEGLGVGIEDGERGLLQVVSGLIQSLAGGMDAVADSAVRMGDTMRHVMRDMGLSISSGMREATASIQMAERALNSMANSSQNPMSGLNDMHRMNQAMLAASGNNRNETGQQPIVLHNHITVGGHEFDKFSARVEASNARRAMMAENYVGNS